MAEPAATFDEIRSILAEMPSFDEDAAAAARARQAELTKPPGSLGRLEDIAIWMAGWQGRHPPDLRRPRVAVFAGNHGVAARGVSAFPAEVTTQMVQNFINGGAAINQLCSVADSDLRVYELDLDNPTEDFSTGPAMDEDACARAIAYGMMAVEPGVQLLAVGEMGIANTTSASALCTALFGGEPSDWVGPGSGVDGDGVSHKATVIGEAMRFHSGHLDDPLDVLCRVGGLELAAIAGAVLAARMGRVPVILDGFACTASAAVLEKLVPGAIDHCLVAHCSREPGHRRLLDAIGKKPLFDLEMRLGEASGAALAIPVVKAAVECHTGMATFAEAGVTGG